MEVSLYQSQEWIEKLDKHMQKNEVGDLPNTNKKLTENGTMT